MSKGIFVVMEQRYGKVQNVLILTIFTFHSRTAVSRRLR